MTEDIEQFRQQWQEVIAKTEKIKSTFNNELAPTLEKFGGGIAKQVRKVASAIGLVAGIVSIVLSFIAGPLGISAAAATAVTNVLGTTTAISGTAGTVANASTAKKAFARGDTKSAWKHTGSAALNALSGVLGAGRLSFNSPEVIQASNMARAWFGSANLGTNAAIKASSAYKKYKNPETRGEAWKDFALAVFSAGLGAMSTVNAINQINGLRDMPTPEDRGNPNENIRNADEETMKVMMAKGNSSDPNPVGFKTETSFDGKPTTVISHEENGVTETLIIDDDDNIKAAIIKGTGQKIENTNEAVANAHPGDYLIRDDGTVIIVNTGDIDWAQNAEASEEFPDHNITCTFNQNNISENEQTLQDTKLEPENYIDEVEISAEKEYLDNLKSWDPIADNEELWTKIDEYSLEVQKDLPQNYASLSLEDKKLALENLRNSYLVEAQELRMTNENPNEMKALMIKATTAYNQELEDVVSKTPDANGNTYYTMMEKPLTNYTADILNGNPSNIIWTKPSALEILDINGSDAVASGNLTSEGIIVCPYDITTEKNQAIQWLEAKVYDENHDLKVFDPSKFNGKIAQATAAKQALYDRKLLADLTNNEKTWWKNESDPMLRQSTKTIANYLKNTKVMNTSNENDIFNHINSQQVVRNGSVTSNFLKNMFNNKKMIDIPGTNTSKRIGGLNGGMNPFKDFGTI